VIPDGQAKNVGAPVDWEAIRRRLQDAIDAIGRRREVSREDIDRILLERARALAKPTRRSRAGEGVVERLVFHLGSARFSIEMNSTLEIVAVDAVTPIPGSPAHLAGVINLRGGILPAFDLRPILNVESAGSADLKRAIVLGKEAPEFGVLVEKVESMTVQSGEAISPLPESTSRRGQDFIRGVAADGVVALDGAALLADPQFECVEGDAAVGRSAHSERATARTQQRERKTS
jgi:purine-binding chemotaxis protein CheW